MESWVLQRYNGQGVILRGEILLVMRRRKEMHKMLNQVKFIRGCIDLVRRPFTMESENWAIQNMSLVYVTRFLEQAKCWFGSEFLITGRNTTSDCIDVTATRSHSIGKPCHRSDGDARSGCGASLFAYGNIRKLDRIEEWDRD